MAFTTYVPILGDDPKYCVPRISNPDDVVAHVLNPYGGQLNPNPPTPADAIAVTVNLDILATV